MTRDQAGFCRCAWVLVLIADAWSKVGDEPRKYLPTVTNDWNEYGAHAA